MVAPVEQAASVALRCSANRVGSQGLPDKGVKYLLLGRVKVELARG